MMKKTKIKQYSVERGFISKLMESKDFKLLKEQQIQPFFLTGDNRRVFQYIQECFKTTGEIPTPRVLKQKFPNYELEIHTVDGNEVVGTDETFLYWCKELRTKAKHNRMADITEAVAEKLDEGSTEEAYALMKQGVWKIEDEIVESSSVDITKDTEDRKEVYLERKRNKGMMGIPTGISHLDYMLKGLIKETLTTLIATTGQGKAVTLDTPILTPDGFIPMRDIKVGSKVFDEKGNECRVQVVFPQGKKQVYRIHFEDGTYVDCCKDHLWKFKTKDDVARNNDWRVETTEQLLQRPLKRGKAFNLSVPVNEAVVFPHKDLPLDPYVLGCLLGDGGFTTDRITFTNPEKDLLSLVNNKLKDWGSFEHHKGTDCQYVFVSNNSKENKLYRTVKSLGLTSLRSEDKYIPKEFLYTDEKQRLKLLQGLIDTDGCVQKRHTQFSTFSVKLKDDIMWLIRSLGYRCSYGEYTRDNKTEYVVRIWSDSDIFFTSLKHNHRYYASPKPNRNNHYDLLKITNIEILDNFEEMQCITVDSPYHTFICGDFIVTHNTWFMILVGAYAQLNGYKVVCFITEMSADIMRDRFEAMLFGMMYNDFNYNNFKSGALTKEQEDLYFEFLEEDLPKLEPLVLETATGVSSVVAVIEQEKPDLVLVDGAYLMEDEQGAKDDWLRVTHITRDLKKVAKNWHIPILINTQADQNTSKKTGPGLGDIKYSQAIGQDCLPMDSIILTEQGYKRIQLLEKEVFKVFDGENYKKATCVYAGKKQVTTITYRGIEFSCSPNHKLLVYDNEVENFVWKIAKDIEPYNDFLLEQNFHLEEGHEHVLRVVSQRGSKDISIPLEADYELGMFIGMFIGDGSLKPIEKGQVTISCGQDIEYSQYCIDLCERLFNIRGEVKPIKSSTSGREELVAVWYSVKLADWLSFFCCDGELNKTVKVDYCEMNHKMRLGVLAGLIQSDGSCIGQLEIVSSDYSVIRGTELLFKTFGVTTRYDYSHNNTKGKNRIRVMTNDLTKLKDIHLVGIKKKQFNTLLSKTVCGRLVKPESYIKNICKEAITHIKDTNSNLYKSVKLAITTGQLGQNYLDEISNQPYKFMQVEDVTTILEEVDMWDIQVFSDDKRIITNGIVNHNSDNILALFRDEIMINDSEMGIRVLKQREGVTGKAVINWDFNHMNFSSIYSESNNNSGDEVSQETNDKIMNID